MNLTFSTGPQDLAALRGELNDLKRTINLTSPGLLNAQGGSVGNAADATDDTLYQYIIAAGDFATYFPTGPGGVSGIRVRAWGTYAGNGNNKTAKIFFGSLTAFTTGVVTANTGTWSAEAIILRTGVSTQKALGVGLTVATPIGNLAQDHTQDETAAITVKVTGASPTTQAANDVLGKGFLIEAIR